MLITRIVHIVSIHCQSTQMTNSIDMTASCYKEQGSSTAGWPGGEYGTALPAASLGARLWSDCCEIMQVMQVQSGNKDGLGDGMLGLLPGVPLMINKNRNQSLGISFPICAEVRADFFLRDCPWRNPVTLGFAITDFKCQWVCGGVKTVY